MGSVCAGGIVDHLSRLTDAVRDWLDYMEAKANGENEEMMFLADREMLKPEQPEAFILLRRLRESGLSYFSGGLYNQPYIMMLEFAACRNGESEHRARVEANAKMKAKFSNGGKGF